VCPLADSDQIEFEAWIEQTVAAALERPHADFASLTSTLPGIYPQEVLRALYALDGRRAQLNGVPAMLAVSARHQIAVPRPPSGLLGLLPPHPLDFEWRFAPHAIDLLTDAVLGLTPRGAGVALVGTPTLAATRAPAMDVLAVDYYGMDARTLAELGVAAHLCNVYTADLLQAPEVRERYTTLVMDPPWYEEHVRRFLYFAASALRLGGHLLLAVGASGTRPGIAGENRRTLAWAENLGLTLKNIRPGALPYETPPFERNALRAAGILNVGADWRRGDLWTLCKETSRSPDWPGNITRAPWKDFRFGAVRVRVDTGGESIGPDPSLRSIVEGDVLPTVSRRDARRAAVRVWTTGNRVFACDAPLKFASMVEAWHEPKNIRDLPHDVEQSARDQFFSIIERERIELAWPCGDAIDLGTC